MTALWLAVRYIAARPLLNGLTALAVAAGIALVVATNALSSAARRSAQDTAGGYQLLVAAKGSPVQAVLSTLFYAEAPTGNIPRALYDEIKSDSGVTLAVPFAFGDSYRGFFIVGTTDDYPKLLEATHGRGVRFAAGGRWPAAPFEVAVGAAAASATGLKPGDRFTAAHGFVELPKDLARHHDEHAYTVVAVLEPTHAPADRALFTTLETAWLVHGAGHGAGLEAAREGKEITALVLHGRSYGDVARLSATLARRADVQAVFPGRVATQVLNLLQRGQAIATGMAWLAAIIASFAITVSLLAASIERRRQIAMLRAIGASRRAVFGVLACEAAIVAGVGALAGIALGRVVTVMVAARIARESGMQLIAPPLGGGDLAIAAAAVALGIAAGAIPAYLASRHDVARDLAPTA